MQAFYFDLTASTPSIAYTLFSFLTRASLKDVVKTAGAGGFDSDPESGSAHLWNQLTGYLWSAAVVQ